jgi:hypothetical protein
MPMRRKPGGLPYPLKAKLQSQLQSTAQVGLPSPVIDPVSWRNTYQGGALDLAVNIALLALSAGPLIRQPLFVTAPTRPAAPQIEHSVNVAVRAAAPFSPQSSPEPTYFKRWAQQPDLAPNIAVQLQTAMPAGSYIDPQRYKPVPPAPDIYPNIAAPLYVVPTPRAPLFVSAPTRPNSLQIDVLPNVAANAAPPPYQPTPAIDPTTFKRPAPQLDQPPNIAVGFQTARPAGTYIDPQLWRLFALVPEIAPNLAVKFQTAITHPGPEPTFTPKAPQQIDLAPNLASLTYVVPTPRAPLYVTAPTRPNAPQIDQAPNVAASVSSAHLPPAPIEPTLWRARFQFDLFPNATLLTPAPPAPQSRGAPLYVTAPTPVIRWSPELFPNIAIHASVIPPPPTPKALPPKIRFIYPRGMTAANWCNQMSLALAPATQQLPTVTSNDDWKVWATSVTRQIGMAKYTLPMPGPYKSWRAWADDFIRCLSDAGL